MLLGALIAPMAIGDILPYEVKSFFYALSLSIKTCIVFVLPFIIFSFISYSLISLGSRALSFAILLIAVVLFSNFSAIMIGYQLGSFELNLLKIDKVPGYQVEPLIPLWNLELPKLIANEASMIFGLLFGGLFSFLKVKKVTDSVTKFNMLCTRFLRRVFIPMLPLFIIGFVIKLDHDDILITVVKSYGAAFFIIVTAQILYTMFMFMIAANFSINKFKTYIRNIMPATFTAFTTMSSAATIPVTIHCTEQNMPSHRSIARTVVPVTANIHTLGSAIGVTVLAIGTLLAFDMPIPPIMEFAEFALFFAIAKFAVVGIPGGVILVISPLLETHLGFTPEMIGIITSIYLLFDPFGTATNVTCNGAFAIIFYRFYKMITGKEIAEEVEDKRLRV